MDRDNQFGSSYLREGATRVRKPRLTYRPTNTAVAVGKNTDNAPVANKWSAPHLRLRRRLSLTSDTTNKPPVANDDDSETDRILQTHSRNDARRSTASTPMGSNGLTATRRGLIRNRVVRPADHSRPTVHFSSGRSDVILTLPASGEIPTPATVARRPRNIGDRFPELPSVHPSTVHSRRPGNRVSVPIFGADRHVPPYPICSSVHGSTAGSIFTNHNGTNTNTRKTVTFDSSETEDSFSCLSNSTQATSVDEREHYGYDDYLPKEKSIPDPLQATATVNCSQHAPSSTTSSTATMLPPTRSLPTRRRSRSFSGCTDHELHRTESGLVHVPTRWSLIDSYSRTAFDATKGTPVPSSTSSTISRGNTSEMNSLAQFEAHKVALEAQFEQRRQTLESEQKKLAVELKEAITALGEAQAERNDLRREAAEHRQRAKALAEEVDDLHASMDKSLQRKDTETQELLELRADLESSKMALEETNVALAAVKQALADANANLTQLRDSLHQEETNSALFREGKAVFEERCSDLEVKCEGLEGQVVAARDANKELHLLMAGQIEDLKATKNALQVRIGILEEEEASRVAVTAAAVAAAAAAEEKVSESASKFADERTSLEERLTASESKRTAQESERQVVETEVNDLKDQIETMNSNMVAKTTELEALMGEFEKVKKENTAHQETITRHEAALDKAHQAAEGAVDTVETETSDSLGETISKLEEARAALSAECEALKIKAETGIPATADSDNSDSTTPDAELQEKYLKLEGTHVELQEKIASLEASLSSEKEAAAAALDKAQTDAGSALADAQNAATAAKVEAAAHAAQLSEITQQNINLATEIAAQKEILQELRAAYATSEAEGMALRDQLAKMRAKLAGVAGSVTSNGSGASKKGGKKNSKDDLVIVRTPGDRGRFQVMRKSDLHRSPSRSSRKNDYDSA
ncbi:uncharacterized protein SPSK_02217 [Sporothrix schenckii 1099-18]|uniref:Uncharacterized protein n=1 Tax=Sporothrix schenckii 1099-18 TaxID=1397361 RepID=A0A0F2MD47_SPOSC|nr:uncharacterized protein SPSK_02217 [Sporothrix schenckii 1099-18]KJR86066.1 hypothetical protein SPSK_02217 [Sporothrix schenckii 1099-18]